MTLNSLQQPHNAAASKRGPGFVRQALESLVFLTCAVVLFRSFAAEGYMISTGSMAPALLGYHRQVTCSACDYCFAHGATSGISTATTAAAQAEILGHLADVSCPNCGQATSAASQFPRNEGDQLLVHKHAYEFRRPRRWETVVFRNPTNPLEAYVKRVGGLPDEQIEITRGDVYADGLLQRKSLLTQRSMRVLVYDDAYRPGDDRWQRRWQFGPHVVEQDGRYDIERSLATDEWTSVEYQHWIRAGGNHRSKVSVPQWPADATTIAPDWPQLRYDSKRGHLIAQGVLDRSWHQRLRTCTQDPTFVAAIDELEAKSHLSPIVDHYGYNRDSRSATSYAVRDLMWAAHVRAVGGQFRIQMLYGRQPFFATFDIDEREVSISTLGPNGREDLLASGPFDPLVTEDTGALIEMSLIDRQVLLAVNGELVLPEIPFAATEAADRRSRSPVRFEARYVPEGEVTSVANVRLYRDVYVTPKGPHGSRFRVGPDEYFVLGDNSPVSVDSRMWNHPAVAHSALIGKPFLVHLPSRQQTVNWGGEVRHVRLPDWDRVRYVR